MSFPQYVTRSTGYQYPHGLVTPPASECYSNLAAYGVHGAVSGIQAPTPVSAFPTVFSKLGTGHKIPPNPHHYQTTYNYPGVSPPPKNCGPYLSMNQTCGKSEFNQMFNDRRHLDRRHG
jgi:hypothetical protein